MASVQPQLWNLITRFAPQYGLDPRAVAAVSTQEGGGRFGEVGDQGTSFGPWQLHVGGALPAGRGAAWANSPAGVRYALSRMGQVAGGLTGRAAVAAIVNRFERPAAPQPEIAGAWAAYQGLHPGAAGPTTPAGGGGGGGGGTTPGMDQATRTANAVSQLQNFAFTGNVSTPSTSPAAQMTQSLMASQKAPTAAGGSGSSYSGPASGAARSMLTSARAMIGRPYQWGGESPAGGFDCSGLVQWAFARAGISVPRTSQAQAQHGRSVKWGSFHPGDLIFSNFDGGRDASHVVIYLGNGKVIAAPHTGANVMIENVNAFKQNFVGARRYF